MSKMSRNKGANGEREVVRLCNAHGFSAKRSFYQIDGDREDVIGLPGFAIEVKRTERLELWAALDQAAAAAKAVDARPLLAFRRNNWKWHVALPMEDFLELLARSEFVENAEAA